MLKWQKTNAHQLVETINEAHTALSQLVSVPEYSEAVAQLKEGCKQCADTFTEMDGGFASAAAFYKTAVDKAETPDDALALNAFSKDFSLILSNIKIKLEFVFFSYKISMFDSFETVVRACNEDNDIEAFVVPIPYFEKNTNGSLGKMHFEDMKNLPQYSDLNIADYRSYDVKMRRPDAVFINNPYDDNNAVSSVNPNFYCENLAGYTDLLVYIPYYVTPEIDTPSQMIPRHFVETTGCIFADKVFVQSENARLGNIHHYRDIVKHLSNSKMLLEHTDKFIAVGSPKFEKILIENENTYALPDDWKRKIYNADGRKKPTFFLNTGISNFLFFTFDSLASENSRNYLDMLESTLKTFEERDDIALLWRPHPLFENSVKTARPALLERYKKIVEDYKTKDFGIYDLSEDYHIALTVCDALIGDVSSLVQVFAMSAKPSLLSSVFLDKRKYFIDAQVTVKDDRYFTIRSFAKLWKTNSDGITKPVADLPCVSDCGELSFSGMAHSGGKIYIAPKSASEILVYDIENNTVSTFDYDKTFIGSSLLSAVNIKKFVGVAACDNYVYFIGKYYPAIIKFDTVTGEKTYIRSYVKKLSAEKSIATTSDFYSYISEFDICGDFIYAVSDRFPGYIEINTANGNSKFVTVEGIEKGVTAIAVSGNKAYLGDFYTGSPIVVFDIKKREIITRINLPENFDSPFIKIANSNSIHRYSSFRILGGKLYVFPFEGTSLLEIDLADFAVKILTSHEFTKLQIYHCTEITDDEIYFSNHSLSPEISVIKNGKVKSEKLQIDLSNLPFVYGKIPYSVYFYPDFANFEFTLEDFIEGFINGLYKDKIYFDEATKTYAEYNLKSSKRIIQNCKNSLKKRC
jgi:hypothetical protein